LLSPRNSEQASTHLFGATECAILLYSPERSRQVDALKNANASIQTWEIPGLWDVFAGNTRDVTIQIAQPSIDVEERVAVYIHSSGTTGWSSDQKHLIRDLQS
jgi:hypothetical protein